MNHSGTSTIVKPEAQAPLLIDIASEGVTRGSLSPSQYSAIQSDAVATKLVGFYCGSLQGTNAAIDTCGQRYTTYALGCACKNGEQEGFIRPLGQKFIELVLEDLRRRTNNSDGYIEWRMRPNFEFGSGKLYVIARLSIIGCNQ